MQSDIQEPAAGAADPQLKLPEHPLLAEVHNVPQDEACWFYIDPEGRSQGPCSITHFFTWLLEMSRLPSLAAEYRQFQSVGVWREGMRLRMPLLSLLDTSLLAAPQPSRQHLTPPAPKLLAAQVAH